ncbi:MAG: hypothetical protein IIC81_07995 [Chloroflexi bacterium]|nr:hypothetical protein [Chloroflexota bacterium]
MAMLEYIIKGLSNHGDTILDPFVGTGTLLFSSLSAFDVLPPLARMTRPLLP